MVLKGIVKISKNGFYKRNGKYVELKGEFESIKSMKG